MTQRMTQPFALFHDTPPRDLCLALLRSCARSLNRHMKGIGTEDRLDFATLMGWLHQLDTIIDALQTTRADLQLAAWRHRGEAYGDVELDGLPAASVRRTKDRRQWDHRATAFDIVRAHMEAIGGEVVDPNVIADWLLDAAGITYWKVTTLKGLDLDPADYSELVTGNPKIEFTKPRHNPILLNGSNG